jgi:lipopolysaccharide/colanic/teichoic acid biosynthesis glycosyltransferase
MGNNMEYSFYKRRLDLCGSFLGMVFLAPLFAIVSLAILIDSGRPVLFRQNRVGKNGKVFKIYKFRTMVKNASTLGQNFTTPANDARITKVGRFLRCHNIDELPQLVNVWKGEMSLVGPRPEVPEIVKLYSKDQRKVLAVLPGLTDYASLEFRREGELINQSDNLYRDYVNKILPKKLELQLKYVQEKSFCADIGLIFKTIASILGK